MAERTVAMLVGTMSDAEVADATGLTSGEVRQWREEQGIQRFRSRTTPREPQARPATQKLLRRKKGGSEVEEVFVATTDEEELPPEPVPPVVQRGGRRPAAERLAAVRDQLGKLPDDVIADQVGLSRGVVGAYRRQHKIPAYEGYLFQKGHAPHVKKEAAPAPPAPKKSQAKARREKVSATPTPPADPVVVPAPMAERAAVAGRRGPRSRIEDHLDLLGVETDATVARLAGVTRAAVSAWRRARGISAAGAQPTPTAEPVAPGPTAPAPAPAPLPKAVMPAPTAPDEVVPSVVAVAAFRMVAVADGAKLEFVAIGATMADACGRAQRWLAHRPGDWRLDEVRYLADAVL